MEDDDVLVIPPMPADPVFVEAVDDAVSGEVHHPEAQPERAVGADPRDFASLYIRHRSSFALHARRFLNDPRDVDEVLQEAFLRLFLAMPELDTELQALSYCRRTVTNLCIDRWRADQRRPRLVDLDSVQLDPSDEGSYDDPVLRAEDAVLVREALSLLSPLHRAALVKREIEEKSLPQIAAELDIPEESVKHLLHRARRALRRLLVGTTAEPGVDLSNTEMLAIANARLARATLRGANVLIVLFVAAVTVVGGLRVVTRDGGPVRSGGLTTAVTPGVLGGAGNPAPTQPTPRRHSHGGHDAHATAAPSSATTPDATSAPDLPQPRHDSATGKHVHVTPPPADAPVEEPPVDSLPTGPAPGTFTINAPILGAVGSAAVKTESVDTQASGVTTHLSSFDAVTSTGDFVLEQQVQRSSEGVVSANLLPSVTIADADGYLTEAGTHLSSSSVSTEATADGNVLVSVDLLITPESLTAGITAAVTQPLSVTVEALYTPDVTQVLAETVSVVEGSAPCCDGSPASTTLPKTSDGAAVPSTAIAEPSATVSPLSPTRRGDEAAAASS